MFAFCMSFAFGWSGFGSYLESYVIHFLCIGEWSFAFYWVSVPECAGQWDVAQFYWTGREK